MNSFFLLVLWVKATLFVEVHVVVSLMRVTEAFSFSWLSMLSCDAVWSSVQMHLIYNWLLERNWVAIQWYVAWQGAVLACPRVAGTEWLYKCSHWSVPHHNIKLGVSAGNVSAGIWQTRVFRCCRLTQCFIFGEYCQSAQLMIQPQYTYRWTWQILNNHIEPQLSSFSLLHL